MPDGRIDSYDNDGMAKATILRQAGGRTLFAAYDEPDAPASTTAVANRGIVTVNWDDRSNNESLFTVERSTSATSGFSAVANVAANTTSFTDATVAKKKAYYYRVRAANSNGTSGYSNVARVYVK